MTNGVEYVAAQWAIWRSGGVAVPLCVSHPPKEWEYVLTNANCEAVVVGQNFLQQIAPIGNLHQKSIVDDAFFFQVQTLVSDS